MRLDATSENTPDQTDEMCTFLIAANEDRGKAQSYRFSLDKPNALQYYNELAT
jgi:hypothetical protein